MAAQTLDIVELQKQVRRIEIVSNRLVSERMAGEYHSVFKGQGMEFEEVRPYSLGDDVRSIDWNVTARAGDPHVKRFREEREMTVFFIVDLSASSRFGTHGSFKSELMAEICAVLALSAIANNDRVGLLLATDRIEAVIPPRKGRRHVLRLVREVLAFEPEGHGTDLAQALDHLRHVLHRKAVVFLISDFLGSDYEQSLAVVAGRHDLVAIDVVDPIELALPKVGMIELMDAETGEVRLVDTSDRRFRENYAKNRGEALAAREQMLRRHKIDRLALRTGEEYEPALMRFFRERALRQRHA